MSRYANGMIPFSALEHIYGDVWLAPATAERFRRLRADVKAETGVTLYITGASARGWDGWNGYRPLASQNTYKAYLGIWAAQPGFSSHGGTFRGGDCMAFDIANWNSVPWEVFSRLAAKHGLSTNFVSPEERWHVGDKNPWVMPAAAGGGNSAPATPTPETDDPMFVIVFNGVQYAIAKQFISHLTGSKAKYAREIAAGNVVHDFGRGNAASIEWQNFMAMFDAMGVPRNVIGNDGKGGEGYIKNPENGKFERGGTWSREREILAALAKK